MRVERNAFRRASALNTRLPPLNQIKKAGNVLTLPARAISTKNKHLLVIYSIPTRGFTAAVSVFRGTPPPKPLECKFWRNTMGALLCERWTDPIGGEPRLSRAIFSIVLVDIIKMSPSYRSQFVHLSFSITNGRSRKIKNPASFTVSRVWKNLVLRLPASLRFIQIHFGVTPLMRDG